MKNKQLTIVFKVSDLTKEKMVKFYENKKRLITPPYAVFQAKEEDTVITLYESGKVVFQGMSADVDANIWKEMEKKISGKDPDEKISKSGTEKKEFSYEDRKLYSADTIGSDEVGTGDYFGPIVVTATYVSKENIPFLEKLGVKDSKKMTDEHILRVVPKIIAKIPYTTLILNNQDYNEKYQLGHNMNKIKAILHNKVLVTMTSNPNYQYDYVVVDEFCKPKNYFDYLKESSNIFRNITFTTKAEDKCLSVACASLISRYIFIKEFAKISASLNLKIPKGASNEVDLAGKEIVKQYGVSKLNDIAKLNFKNTDKILKSE